MLPDIYQRWLDGLASGDPEQARPPSPQEVLAQIGEGNPRLQLLARLLAAREQADEAQAPASEAEPPDEPEAGLESEPAPVEPAGGLEPRRVMRNLFAELEDLRARNDRLAQALGACYLCWGEDPACPECHGRGRPGAGVPDRGLYTEYVIPAVRRVQRIQTRRAPAARADSPPARP